MTRSQKMKEKSKMKPCKQYEVKYFYTLKEIVKSFTTLDVEPYDSNTFEDLFYEEFPNAPLWKQDHSSKDYLEELWQLTYARFYDHYTYSGDSETPEHEEIFFVRMINIIVMTYPKYSSLMKYYKDKEGLLMNQIETTGEGLARFNDTPQNEEADDEFEGDLHVTNITKTKSVSATDGVSPIERLKQIQDSYKMVLRDWSNEFEKIFIEEGDITL